MHKTSWRLAFQDFADDAGVLAVAGSHREFGSRCQFAHVHLIVEERWNRRVGARDFVPNVVNRALDDDLED
jgi:hypothetical protein